MVADWPTVAAGCPPDVPAVVVFANRVVAATAAARREGVETGLRRREAQGRCPEVEVVAADPGRDARRWEPVVAAVELLTPAVDVLGPGALALATRGPSRYFGGDSALAERVGALVAEVTGQGSCGVGVADGLFAAGLAAAAGVRCSRQAGPAAGVVVVPPGGSRSWLAGHPVRALGGEYEDFADLLVRLGIVTLGDLAALPGPSVLARFGAQGEAAHLLACGLDDRPLEARLPPPDLVVATEFDPPEERVESAAFVAKALADELLGRLGSAGLAATRVAIEVETEHGESLIRHWRHEGALTAPALAERTRWQLDGWLMGDRAPTGGLTLLRLTPEEVRPDGGHQLGFWGGVADADARAARAMARVQGMLGPDAVVTAVLGGGRDFAEQVRLVSWGDAREEALVVRRPKEPPPPWPGRLGGPSPAIVYDRPPRADLRDEQGRPVEVSGRGTISAAPLRIAIDGCSPAPVAAWAGPWPLEERWWEEGGRRRARLQILLEDGDAYLVTRENGSWWVEASYE
jgi:protein ImuB